MSIVVGHGAEVDPYGRSARRRETIIQIRESLAVRVDLVSTAGRHLRNRAVHIDRGHERKAALTVGSDFIELQEGQSVHRCLAHRIVGTLIGGI